MTLARKHRLRKEADFSQVKEKGRLYSHSFLGILVFNTGKNELSQFGFLISKKISPKATLRIKLKRQLSEIVYPLISQIKPGTKIVFLPKRAIKEKSFLEIKRATEELLTKSGIFENEKNSS
ncbi:MAG: ribonuclease P protein component [Candidatus Shapirobacteria bacterium]